MRTRTDTVAKCPTWKVDVAKQDELNHLSKYIFGWRCPSCEAAAFDASGGATKTHEDIGGEDVETMRYRCVGCRHEWSAIDFDAEYALVFSDSPP